MRQLGSSWTVALVAGVFGCNSSPSNPPSTSSSVTANTAGPGQTATSAPMTPSAGASPSADGERVALDLPDTPSRIEIRSFHVSSLGVDKTYRAYLPKGYDGSDARFPVAYYLHGLGGDESNWIEAGDLQSTADAMSLGAIVIMPDGDASFYQNLPGANDYAACLAEKPPFNPGEPPGSYCVKTRNYETYITDDLIEEVDGRYRTLSERGGRAIAGLSMGGFGALSLGLMHPDHYAAIAAHSAPFSVRYVGPYPYAKDDVELATSLSGWGKRYPPRVRSYLLSLMPSLDALTKRDPVHLVTQVDDDAMPALYLDCGTEDGFGFAEHAKHLHDVLIAEGIEHAFELTAGGHDFSFWKRRLPHSLRFVSAHVAPPRRP